MNDTTEPMTEDQLLDRLVEPETDETEAEEPVEEQTEADEEPVETQDDAEADEADDVEDEDDEDDDGPDEPATFTVKVDGEEIAVSIEDLKQSFSGQKFIQKGMRENADARKALQQREAETAAQAEQFLRFVQSFEQTGYIPAPTPPDPALARSDPLGYVEAQAEFQQQAAIYQGQQQQLEQARRIQTHHQTEARKAFIQEQVELLKAEIPEFADPQKAKALNTEIRSTAIDGYGFTADDIDAISDARVIKVLNDARQWRALQANKGKATEKASKARPVVKAGTAKTATSASRKAERDARQRLRKSGGDDDALALMMRPD